MLASSSSDGTARRTTSDNSIVILSAPCGSISIPANVGGCLRIRHPQITERIDDNVGNNQPGILLIICGNDVPGRVMGACRVQALLKSLSVILPEFPFVNVRDAEFPVLLGIINALEESLSLLALRSTTEIFRSISYHRSSSNWKAFYPFVGCPSSWKREEENH
jgi:hypothetical protein